MSESKKRIALKPHMADIRIWVEDGKSDEWIADALGTSASSVQSFRSRNDIYRRDKSNREPESVFEGVLDKGERDGWGLWLDPSVADDPIWQQYWAGVDSVIVKVAEEAIVLEADNDGHASASLSFVPEVAAPAPQSDGEASFSLAPPDEDREQGRVKWFDADKGYGFLIRPSGEDLFVHHSEVEGNVSDLGPNGEVEYEVGRNDRGPNARKVRLLA